MPHHAPRLAVSLLRIKRPVDAPVLLCERMDQGLTTRKTVLGIHEIYYAGKLSAEVWRDAGSRRFILRVPGVYWTPDGKISLSPAGCEPTREFSHLRDALTEAKCVVAGHRAVAAAQRAPEQDLITVAKSEPQWFGAVQKAFKCPLKNVHSHEPATYLGLWHDGAHAYESASFNLNHVVRLESRKDVLFIHDPHKVERVSHIPNYLHLRWSGMRPPAFEVSGIAA